MIAWCPETRRFLVLIIPLLVAACSHVPDGRTPPVLTQQPPGREQSFKSPKDNEPPPPTQYENYGILFGRVTAPLPSAGGPGRAGAPASSDASAPVGGAQVGVTPAGAEQPWWVITGVLGDYAFLLPAGSYRITMDPRPEMGFARSLPATVVITAGQRTRFDIHLDAGIR